MKKYSINNLRNIGFIGHGSTGKTSLVEALLYNANVITRLGKIEEGTTVSDYDDEEKKRKISIGASIAPLEWNDTKINLVDMPGYFDFEYESIQGMRAVDIATIVVCSVSGVQVGTEKAFDYCNKIKLPRAFFINKLDRENSNFDKTLNELKEVFGISVVPIQYPIGKESDFKGVINVISNKARIYNEKTKRMEIAEVPEEYIDKVKECKEMIMEAVAETDEELLDKYFSGGVLSDDEIYKGLINGCSMGDIAPVMCGSALKCIGMNCLLEDMVECFPSPELSIAQKAINKDNEPEYVCLSEENKFSAFVFKTIADPFVGKMSLFRVITGKLTDDTTVLNVNKNKKEKLSNIFFIRGKNQIPTNEIIAGDIGGVSKLQFTETGDTLADAGFNLAYDKLNFKEPTMSMAILPKAKGDEDKISGALNKLLDEDKAFKVTRDIENAELIISGCGETHLEVIANKIKNKFGAEVILREPKVPYRETIKGSADVRGKHKKQSGGHGQYGDVKIKFERRYDGNDDLEFIDQVVGGVVPRNFIPAVEKGLKDCIKHGVLAGYPVIELKATLHDGSYHPVDSSEMAFKIATAIAYKKGLEEANPVLLEPIMKVEIIIPSEYMGEVIADINKKRGKVIGMEPISNKQKVICEVPLAEMFKYTTDLRSITQARGEYKMTFSKYEEVPKLEASKVIEKTNKEKE
ncbi:translation elongation factor G [Clostridium baratii]|uniref:elongation factor G n=1 Tax=Clostridium baratii TaxID=1561 RepID=UPI0009A2B6A6|nr:elongation factor G [Clostridium baratii]OPF51115.1 elongation factor G [Clostridium baratii]OPF54500.1 translation elongation factor G [Clostridium baratii]OPF56562.1 translation elongation factor G [Clostridium baratii]OPF61388.1 translation elongation factor G [Clostridium baratii]